MPDIEVTDLCDQREPDANVAFWVCTEQLRHDDGGWHYDPVRGEWWRRTASGVEHVSDPERRDA